MPSFHYDCSYIYRDAKMSLVYHMQLDGAETIHVARSAPLPPNFLYR